MVLSLATLTTDIIADEGILDLFLNASWQNLLFFVLFAGVIVFGVNKVAKPQKEQNAILKDFADSIGNLVKNNAVEERSQNERHERYLAEFQDLRERTNRGFDKLDKDVKEVNNTLLVHTATRCGNKERVNFKEVSGYETYEE